MLIWSIGEVLWDVFAELETFGGAPLNVCANLQRLGDQALLLSAVGDDPRGRLALERMRALGLSLEGIRIVPGLPTGVALVEQNESGEASFAIPRPAAFDGLHTNPELIDAGRKAQIDWLYFGTLLQTNPAVEDFTTRLATQLTQTRNFYDMNLRTGHWNLELVQRLSHLATVLKLNDVEAEILFRLTGEENAVFSLEAFCSRWSSRYTIDVICVTLGSAGCMIYDRGTFHHVPGFKIVVGDTVGAGDAFAAGFLHGYHQGWSIVHTARFANALGALVASRIGATPPWTLDEVLSIERMGTQR